MVRVIREAGAYGIDVHVIAPRDTPRTAASGATVRAGPVGDLAADPQPAAPDRRVLPVTAGSDNPSLVR